MLKRWRLSRLLSLSIFFIVLFLITGMILINYLVMVDSIREDTRILRQHSEEMVNTTFHLINTGLEIYDNTFDDEMKGGFAVVMSEYNKTGGDISRLNLNDLSRQTGMDVHIINQSAVIIASSNSRELGLDFNVIYPDFADFLRRIIRDDGFYPDRVVMEYYTGMLTKYAYMPTPDHRYIIELALLRQEFSQERMRLHYNTVMEQIKKNNPDIEEYRIFGKNYRLVYNSSYHLTDDEHALVSRMLNERRNIEIVDPVHDHTRSYLFVDMKDDRHGADMSLITEIVYNTARMQEKIDNLLRYHLILAAIAIIAGACLAILISIRLTRPIEEMVEDIDTIADGKFSHPLRTGVSIELMSLQESIVRLVRSITDLIRDLKDEEQKLHESEERYRAVVENQSDLISRFSVDGTHLFVNEAYCRFAGKPAEQILQTRFKPSMPADELRRVTTFLESLTRENPRGTIEHRIYAADGTTRWYQWINTAFFSEEGTLTEYQSVGRDITDLKNLEESLRSSDQLYRSTIDAMSDGVHVIDRSYTILLFNRGFDLWIRMADLSTGSVIGKNLFTAFPHLDTHVRDEYEQVFTSGEMLITTESGTYGTTLIHTETRKIPIIIDHQCEKIVTIIRDITTQVHAEEVQRNMNLMLEEEVISRTKELESLVQELDSFTYTVSHDLRGPLRAVDGFAHILSMKAETSPSSDIPYYIGKIHDNIRMMDCLIEDLLSFSRMARQPLTKTRIDMNSLAHDVVREMRNAYPLTRFQVTIEDLPPVLGDPALIRQLLVNLISNSMKFSQKRVEPVISLYASRSSEGLTEYHVQDNGIGFDMQYADKIFEVFQRLHPAGEYEGTGVGLAIVKRIIIRHGGSVRVISEEGAGTTVSFSLGGES